VGKLELEQVFVGQRPITEGALFSVKFYHFIEDWCLID